MRTWLRDAGAAFLAAGVVMALLLDAGGIWDHVGGDDLHGHLLPRYVETARALLHEHRLPLWNPWEYCGAPLLGEAQGLTFYLPAPLLFTSLTPYWALQGLYAFNCFVLAWGAIAYLRSHGIPRWGGVVAAWIATAGVFNTPSLAGIDHPHYLAGVAWMPWILLCWERASTIAVRPWLGWLGLVLAAQWFAGYPVFAMDSAVLLGIVALAAGGAPLPRRLVVAATGLALGAALAAIQLLPLADAVSQSVRAVAEDEFVRTRAVLALGSTGMWRHQILGTFGPGTAVLALAAVACLQPARAQLAWLAAAVWAAFALDPPFNLLYEVPPFRGVRYAFGWIHLLPVFWGFLAARGAAMLAERVRPLGPVLAAVLAGGAAIHAGRIVHLAPTRLGFPAPDYALVAQRAAILERTLATFPERPRTIGYPDMHAGTYLGRRMASGAGYNPSMPPAGPQALLDAVNRGVNVPGGAVFVLRNPRLARLLGLGLVAAPAFQARLFERAGFRTLGSLPPEDVLLYQPPVPRVRLVDRVLVEPDEALALRRTIDASRNLVTTAVIAQRDAEHVAGITRGAGAPGTARIVADAPAHVAVEATSRQAALLVLADTWDRGWTATLDGAAAPILQVDHAFRGVAVPPGTHRVEFDYRPLSLRVGAAISAAAMLLVAVLLLRRPRRTRASADASFAPTGGGIAETPLP